MNLEPYGAKSFVIEELVPQFMLDEHGPYRCLQLLDHRVIALAQFNKDYLSGHFDEEVNVIINNYTWGGERDLCGLRPFDCETGSDLSQHKFGRAIDPHYKLARNDEAIPADVIREIITEDPEPWMEAGLTTIESGDYAPTWVHQDVRSLTLDHILIVEP